MDEIEDDQVSIKTSKNGISVIATIFMISNAALGAGLLNFPFAYDEAGGVPVSIFLQTLLLIPACLSMIVLGYYAKKYNTSSYESTVGVVCGRYYMFIAIVCLITYIFFCCITYLIIIGDQFDQVVLYISPKSTKVWYESRNFLIAISSITVILPLCLFKNIGFLRYSSFVGLISIIYIVVYIVVGYFIFPLDPGPIKVKPDRFSDIFLVVPTICFGYQAHVSVIPIMSSMKDKDDLKKFAASALTAILTCMVVYSATGIFGYWSFGSKILPDIIDNYVPPDTALIVGTGLIGLKMMTTYPVLSFCGRLSVFSLLKEVLSNEKYEMLASSNLFFYGFTLLWFSSTLVFAIFIPDITVVISFLGGLAALFSYSGPGLLIYCECIGVVKEARKISSNPEDDDQVSLVSSSNSDQDNHGPVRLDKKFYAKLCLGIFLITFGIFGWALNTAQTVERVIK